jgi:hypothetical protein
MKGLGRYRAHQFVQLGVHAEELWGNIDRGMGDLMPQF